MAEFAFESPRPLPELSVLERALLTLDPAALVDLDASGRTIRMATVLTRPELLACLDAAGLPADPSRLRQLPSTCCGGCSG
jgi:hypothetical protein